MHAILACRWEVIIIIPLYRSQCDSIECQKLTDTNDIKLTIIQDHFDTLKSDDYII